MSSSAIQYFNFNGTAGGTLGGSVGTSQAQLGAQPCRMAMIKADPANTNNVFFGKTGLTADFASTGGWVLDAGQESPWIPVKNLNELFVRADAAGQNYSVLYYQ